MVTGGRQDLTFGAASARCEDWRFPMEFGSVKKEGGGGGSLLLRILCLSVLSRISEFPFDGDAEEAGVAGGVGFFEIVFDPGVGGFGGDFGKVDGGFEGFDLAEEEGAGAGGGVPVGEELASDGGDARVVGFAPEVDAGADLVDENVFFDAGFEPIGIDFHLLLAHFAGA